MIGCTVPCSTQGKHRRPAIKLKPTFNNNNQCGGGVRNRTDKQAITNSEDSQLAGKTFGGHTTWQCAAHNTTAFSSCRMTSESFIPPRSRLPGPAFVASSSPTKSAVSSPFGLRVHFSPLSTGQVRVHNPPAWRIRGGGEGCQAGPPSFRW